MVLHCCLATIPWLSAMFVQTPGFLLLAVLVNIGILVQYLILNTCVLTFIETPGENESFITIGLATLTQTPLEAVKHAVTLINFVAPTFLELSKIAERLGV